MRPDDGENATFAHVHPDLVIKEDGRYLIYYSWPQEDEDEPPPSNGARASQPEAEPWSPQAGPADE